MLTRTALNVTVPHFDYYYEAEIFGRLEFPAVRITNPTEQCVSLLRVVCFAVCYLLFYWMLHRLSAK